MAFTFAHITEFMPTIGPALEKQFKKRYIGFYLYLTFKSANCVEASPNRQGLVGTLFLHFQVDSSVGFGDSTVITTQINIYSDGPAALAYAGEHEKQLTPLLTRIHETLVERFMITYDSDTRQRYAHRFAEMIHEELVAAALHPDRIGRLIESHGVEILDSM
jgi:hypothetical protein